MRTAFKGGGVALASVGSCTEAVVAGDEDVDDGQQILGELLFAAGWVRRLCGLQDHEPCVAMSKEELDELDAVAAEAVAVCDGNLLDMAGEHAFQKGCKAFALVVEARADVTDDFLFRARGLEVGDLADEVFLLFVGRDASVAQTGAGLSGLPLFLFGEEVGQADELVRLLAVVQALAIAGQLDAAETTLAGPLDEGGFGDFDVLRECDVGDVGSHKVGEEGKRGGVERSG